MHIVLIVVLFVLLIALMAAFKKETGVAPPTSKQWSGIKSRARKRGIKSDVALDKWIQNKHRRG
jgi:hypothetical protein